MLTVTHFHTLTMIFMNDYLGTMSKTVVMNFTLFPVIQAIVNEFCDMNCLSQITIFNVYIRNSNP